MADVVYINKPQTEKYTAVSDVVVSNTGSITNEESVSLSYSLKFSKSNKLSLAGYIDTLITDDPDTLSWKGFSVYYTNGGSIAFSEAGLANPDNQYLKISGSAASTEKKGKKTVDIGTAYSETDLNVTGSIQALGGNNGYIRGLDVQYTLGDFVSSAVTSAMSATSISIEDGIQSSIISDQSGNIQITNTASDSFSYDSYGFNARSGAFTIKSGGIFGTRTVNGKTVDLPINIRSGALADITQSVAEGGDRTNKTQATSASLSNGSIRAISFAADSISITGLINAFVTSEVFRSLEASQTTNYTKTTGTDITFTVGGTQNTSVSENAIESSIYFARKGNVTLNGQLDSAKHFTAIGNKNALMSFNASVTTYNTQKSSEGSTNKITYATTNTASMTVDSNALKSIVFSAENGSILLAQGTNNSVFDAYTGNISFSANHTYNGNISGFVSDTYGHTVDSTASIQKNTLISAVMYANSITVSGNMAGESISATSSDISFEAISYGVSYLKIDTTLSTVTVGKSTANVNDNVIKAIGLYADEITLENVSTEINAVSKDISFSANAKEKHPSSGSYAANTTKPIATVNNNTVTTAGIYAETNLTFGGELSGDITVQNTGITFYVDSDSVKTLENSLLIDSKGSQATGNKVGAYGLYAKTLTVEKISGNISVESSVSITAENYDSKNNDKNNFDTFGIYATTVDVLEITGNISVNASVYEDYGIIKHAAAIYAEQYYARKENEGQNFLTIGENSVISAILNDAGMGYAIGGACDHGIFLSISGVIFAGTTDVSEYLADKNTVKKHIDELVDASRDVHAVSAENLNNVTGYGNDYLKFQNDSYVFGDIELSLGNKNYVDISNGSSIYGNLNADGGFLNIQINLDSSAKNTAILNTHDTTLGMDNVGFTIYADDMTESGTYILLKDENTLSEKQWIGKAISVRSNISGNITHSLVYINGGEVEIGEKYYTLNYVDDTLILKVSDVDAGEAGSLKVAVKNNDGFTDFTISNAPDTAKGYIIRYRKADAKEDDVWESYTYYGKTTNNVICTAGLMSGTYKYKVAALLSGGGQSAWTTGGYTVASTETKEEISVTCTQQSNTLYVDWDDYGFYYDGSTLKCKSNAVAKYVCMVTVSMEGVQTTYRFDVSDIVTGTESTLTDSNKDGYIREYQNIRSELILTDGMIDRDKKVFGLIDYASYAVTVQAYDVNGSVIKEAELKNPVIYGKGITINAPTDLQSEQYGVANNVSWNCETTPGMPIKYVVEYSTDKNFAKNVIRKDESITDTELLLTGLSNYATYYWRVQAVSMDGSDVKSAWSETADFTVYVKDEHKPGYLTQDPPTVTVTCDENDKTKGTFYLTQPEYIQGYTFENYHIQMADDADFSNLVIDVYLKEPATEWEYVLENPTSELYYWRVNVSNTYPEKGNLKTSEWVSDDPIDILAPRASEEAITVNNINEDGKRTGSIYFDIPSYTDMSGISYTLTVYSDAERTTQIATRTVTRKAGFTESWIDVIPAEELNLAQNTTYYWTLDVVDTSKQKNKSDSVEGEFYSYYWMRQDAPSGLSVTVDSKTNDTEFSWNIPGVASGLKLTKYTLSLTGNEKTTEFIITVNNDGTYSIDSKDATVHGSETEITVTVQGTLFEDLVNYQWNVTATNSLEPASEATSEPAAGEDFVTYDVTAPVKKESTEPSIKTHIESVDFAWSGFEDKSQPVTYTLEITKDKEFKTPAEMSYTVTAEAGEEIEHQFDGLTSGLEYYWRLIAVDSSENLNTYEETGSFTTKISPGTPYDLECTVFSSERMSYKFSWKEDEASLSSIEFYTVQVSANNTFTEELQTFTTQGTETFVITNSENNPFKENGYYYWRVCANTDETESGSWSSVQTYTAQFDAGNSFDTARKSAIDETTGSYNFNNTVGSKDDPADFFLFDFTDKAGEYIFTADPGSLTLYDVNQKKISYTSGKGINLKSGKYFVSITSKNLIKYEFTATGLLYPEPDEDNDDPVELDERYKLILNDEEGVNGWVGVTDEVDYYYIKEDFAGNITISVSASTDPDTDWYFNQNNLQVQLGTLQGKKFKAVATAKYNKSTNSYSLTKQLELNNTKYYIKVVSADKGKSKNSNYNLSYNGNLYTLSTYDDNTPLAEGVRTLEAENPIASWVGFGDKEDFYSFTVGKTAGLYTFTLQAPGTEGTTFTVGNVCFQIGTVDTKGNFKAITTGKKVTTIAGTQMYTLDRQLSEGTYYVRVYSTDGGKTRNSDYQVGYTVHEYSLSDKTNNTPKDVIAGIKAGTQKPLVPNDSEKNKVAWVGYDDAVDFYQLNVTEYAGLCSLKIFNPEIPVETYKAANLRIQIGTYNVEKDKFTALASGTLNSSNQYILDRQLEIGTYYVKVYSADNGKTKNSVYELSYDLQQYSDSNYLNNTVTDTLQNHDTLKEQGLVLDQLVAKPGVSVSQTVQKAWLGFADPVDYYELDFTNSGSFTVKITDAEQMSNLRIEVGTYNTQTGKYKKVCSASPKNGVLVISDKNLKVLDDTQYLVKVYAADNGKKQANNSYYSMEVSTTYYDSNNKDDTIAKLKENYPFERVIELDKSSDVDWVGYGDSVDFYKVQIYNGQCSLQLKTYSATAKLKLSLCNANGKALKTLSSSDILNGKTLDVSNLGSGSDYYAMVQTTNEDKYMTQYILKNCTSIA